MTFTFDATSLPWAIIAAGVAFLIWIFALIGHLRRTDCSDTDKIIWTIVLCTLNIIGVILYWFLEPRGPNERVLTDDELKERFNRGT